VAGRRDPRWPRHSHHDPDVSRTWRLKDALPARGLVYYGKLLRGRPVLMALDVFAAWYALVRGRQRARDYRVEHAAGRLSERPRRLMDALVGQHPLYTRDWRAEAFLLDPASTRAFEGAVAELQAGLWVVKTEERYEPTFSYRWDLVEAWLPGPVQEGRAMGRRAAIGRLLDRYLGGAGWGTEAGLARLFGLPRAEVREGLAVLVRSGVVKAAMPVEGWPAPVVVHRAAP
jgi:hypothetical protein